tara:strand:- start:534 stop:1766 length:1233 start_codon:yes stop_codon:yes gene_type:complete
VLPDETSAPREIAVEGGPRIFRTPHFEFDTDQEVSHAFISEAARVYEGTFYALDGLPHGLVLKPPGGSEFYRGKLMGDQAFNEVVSEVMPSLPGQRVVGLYMTNRQELLVPFSSLGAKVMGSRLTLRKSSDTTTLIHEIVHQLMHDWLPLVPTWFAEGMSEYVASVPYQNGRFEFRNSERGLKGRLEGQYGVAGATVTGVRRPSAILGLEALGSISSETRRTPEGILAGVALDAWGGTIREYRDAMLLIYYFMHLDLPERAGAPIGAYLRLVDLAKEETGLLEVEVIEFEKKRIAYNEQVKHFNQLLDQFREEAEGYNERVILYNDQVKLGLPENEIVVVGIAPTAPVPPEEFEMPEAIRKAQSGGAIDLVGLVQGKALPALIRDRSAASIDASMREAFAGIGIEIKYEL